MNENALYDVPFSITLKNMIMFTYAQNMYQIIYRNVQVLK